MWTSTPTRGSRGEWQFHHQGGRIGYKSRTAIATPTSTDRVAAGEAYAWNPTIAGTKCEDTIFITEGGIRMITRPGPDWPAIEVERDGEVYRRADILVKA